jgi:FKBP-type peptidyl-prolyl cis-trans isomerase
MKKLILFTCLLTVSVSLLAQPAKPGTKPAVKKPGGVASATMLKTLNDSASYAIGLSMANFYKQQGIPNLNAALITKACNDVYGNKPTLLNEGLANEIMNKLMMKIQEDKVKPTIAAGQAFLIENKKKAGVKTTASGLQYEVIEEGTGIKPTAIDTFVVQYRGTLLNGTQFDASYDRGQPLIMPLTGVIKGWTEGLQLMGVGSKYKFYIPHNLAYGSFDNGAIPGGSTLVFEIELLDVKKRQ